MIDKFKKQVGFIKHSSSKKNVRHLQPSHSESSDSFSSFQFNPYKERQQEFSPYRHPANNGESFRPHSREQKRKLIMNNTTNSPPKFSNQILRNNFTRDFKNDSKTADFGKKQLKDSHGWSHQQNQKREYRQQNKGEALREEEEEEELSLSNIHKFQKSKQNQRGDINVQQHKLTKELKKHKKYLQQESSSSDDSQDQFQAIHKRQTVKRPIQKKERTNSNYEQELITEYDKRQFKDKSIKRAILEQQNIQKPKAKGLYETKGGVCFQLDTKQFKGPVKGSSLPKKKKKKPEADLKYQLIHRRQMAKMYDRQARGKLFGYY